MSYVMTPSGPVPRTDDGPLPRQFSWLHQAAGSMAASFDEWARSRPVQSASYVPGFGWRLLGVLGWQL